MLIIITTLIIIILIFMLITIHIFADTKDLQGVSDGEWVIVITVQLAGVLPRVLVVIMV